MEVREYIIEEADRLFCQYGFKSVTMDDIARHLGMSKKTIYQNFSDKNELVNLLIKEKLDFQKCSNEIWSHNALNAVDEIFMSMENGTEILSNMNPKLFYDLQKYYPKAFQMFHEHKNKFILTHIYDNLARGVEEDLYRSDLNIDIIARLRLEQIELIFNHHDHFTQNRYTLAQVMMEITEHFLYGVCNKKGLALIEEYKAEELAKKALS